MAAKQKANVIDQADTKLEHAAAQAVQFIADAAIEASKVIANSALDATKVVANSAAEANKMFHTRGAEDHDTLLILVESVNNLDKRFTEKFTELKTDIKADIKDLKDTTTSRIQLLETEKLNIRDSYPVLYKAGIDKALDDHEKRLRKNGDNITKIMTWGAALLVILGIAQFFIGKFL